MVPVTISHRHGHRDSPFKMVQDKVWEYSQATNQTYTLSYPIQHITQVTNVTPTFTRWHHLPSRPTLPLCWWQSCHSWSGHYYKHL